MNLSAYTYRLQGFLQEAKNILVVIKKNPDIDTVSAGLSLYLSLIQKGKQVTIVCPDKMTVAFSDLFAVDKISDKIGQDSKNLVISFPYVEGSIEKVSYNIANNRFNLVIEPRGEEKVVNKENIDFSNGQNGSSDFDIIFFIGVGNANDLGDFQNTQTKFFSEKPSILINTLPINLPFGTMQIVPFGSVTISEIITLLISKMNLAFDRDIANNLLRGIKEKTQNFSKASADSFEAASVCMRKTVERPNFGLRSNQQNVKPAMEVKKAPPDWLKPKIFRSGIGNQNSNNTSINVPEENKGTIL